MGAHIDRSSSSKVTVRRAAAGTVRLAPTTGPRGPEGPASTVPGPPGGSDESFAAWVEDADSQTRAALSATYARRGEVGQTAIAIPDVRDFRTVGVPSAALTIPTYDGSGVAVHPSVLFFPDGWAGHRYWMAMTPYPGSNVELENPSIVVSDDGYTWAVPAGLTNPLAPSPAGTSYNSDPAITLGPDGRMYLVYRQYLSAETPQRDELMVMSSADGITWTTPQVILSTDPLVQRIVSPAFWYDGGADEWVMIGVDIVPATRVIKRFTAPEATGPWTADATAPVAPAWPAGRMPWHIDARYVGGTVIALIQEGDQSGGALYLAKSSDGGRTFTRSTVPQTPRGFYKSTMVPLLTPGGIALDLYVGTLAGTVRRVLTSTEGTKSVLSAVNGMDQYVFGDAYNRADSATSVGTATDGHAYTIQAGTAGISGRKGYAAVAGNTKVVSDCGITDGVFTLDLFGMIGTQGWLIFRGSDTNNYWRCGVANGTDSFRLEKIVAGAATAIASISGPPVDGDRITVECNGSSIKAAVNGALIASTTDSFNQTATLIGWQTTVTAAKVKNLTARTL